MTRFLFAFCLIASILVAVFSDWRMRNMDGRPLKNKTGITTIALENSELVVGAASVDITNLINIQETPSNIEHYLYNFSAPWNLNKRFPKEKKGETPETRKLTSIFFCRAISIKSDTNITALIAVDLPALSEEQISEAKDSISKLGINPDGIIFTTPGFVAPVTISSKDFARVSASALRKALESADKASYSLIDITDTSLSMHHTKINIPDIGAIDIPGKSNNATDAANRWLSFFTNDSAIFKAKTLTTSSSTPANISALVFRNDRDKFSACLVFSNIRPLLLAGENSISTDIAGIISQHLEKKLECPVLFLTMPDIDKSLLAEEGDIATARRSGTRIAQLIHAELKRTRYSVLKKAYAYSHSSDIPKHQELFLSPEVQKAKSTRYALQVKQLIALDLDLYDKRKMFERTIRFSSYLQRMDTLHTNIMSEIKGWRLDTISIFFLPCNISSETADSLARIRPQRLLFSAGLNGYHDAILSDKEQDEGGWLAATSVYSIGSESVLLQSMNNIISSTFPRIFKKRLKE
jgi:hypothetical protein